jgi:hypothetical protein
MPDHKDMPQEKGKGLRFFSRERRRQEVSTAPVSTEPRRRHSTLRLLAAVLLVVVGLGAMPVAPTRCGRRLVSVGELQERVWQQCGEPTAREWQMSSQAVPWESVEGRAAGRVYKPVLSEVWVYNWGPRRCMVGFAFRAGRLVEIQQLDSGYEGGTWATQHGARAGAARTLAKVRLDTQERSQQRFETSTESGQCIVWSKTSQSLPRRWKMRAGQTLLPLCSTISHAQHSLYKIPIC